jgi:urease accessory protein
LTDWRAWQIADSAFPTGGFAHSWGLEAAWQQGEVADRADLARFTAASIQQAAFGVVPFVNAAYREPSRLLALDALAEAFLTNAVANKASRAQGRTLLATVATIWPRPALDALKARAADSYAHAGPITGASLRAIDMPLATVQRLVLFCAVRGVLAAAVRLGIAGGYEAQRLQDECAPWLDAQLERCAGRDERDVAQTAPILDMLQAGHDRLYSRLFVS